MKKYWDSLRSFEKRVVMVLGVFFFVVINLLFVRPYFSEMAVVRDRAWQAEQKLAMYEREIAKKTEYDRKIKALETQGGSSVPQEDQANHFATAVEIQAGQSKVGIVQRTHITYQTNQFFLELSQNITAQAGETNLVEFLYNLGSGSSLIRAQDLNLRPEMPARQNLQAGIKLVASYQKKTPAKSTAPARGASSGSKTKTSTGSSPRPTAK